MSQTPQNNSKNFMVDLEHLLNINTIDHKRLNIMFIYYNALKHGWTIIPTDTVNSVIFKHTIKNEQHVFSLNHLAKFDKNMQLLQLCNKKITPTKLQKMIIIYNAINTGWNIHKNNKHYYFSKKHNNDAKIYSENYLNNFIKDMTIHPHPL